jgi:hypothetical protein
MTKKLKIYLECSVQDEIVSGRNLRVNVELPAESIADDRKVCLSVVRIARSEEGEIEVAEVVVDGAATAVSSGQGDVALGQGANVGFLPRILVASDHHTGLVFPEEEHTVLGEVVLLVQPVLKRKVGEDVVRLGNEDRTRNGRLLRRESRAQGCARRGHLQDSALGVEGHLLKCLFSLCDQEQSFTVLLLQARSCVTPIEDCIKIRAVFLRDCRF